MNFTDIFIKRPVLASVVSLFILVLGIRAGLSLQVLQFPRVQTAVVTITTTYPGADPQLVAGFITTPIENAVAQANGIDYMNSTSLPSVSTVTVNLRLNYDSDRAMTEINAKLSSVLSQLPAGSQTPVVTVAVGGTFDAMYMGFTSTVLPANNITDYVVRVVQPKLQTVPGVQTAEILGAQNFALRAWLDPQKLASYGLSADDIKNSLAANDFISALGNSKGQMVQINLAAATGLTSLDGFRNLVVKRGANGAVVRLQDVANVTLGSDNYETAVHFDGKSAVFVGIQVAPAANLLDVIKGVKETFPEIQEQLPQGLSANVVYDSTDYVNSSIEEVIRTLVEALLIVTVVVFVFLGNWRSVVIPVVAIPLSLTGALGVMLLLGFSINLLTLLSLVLAIGLVVDDAIIVVENTSRHLSEGMRPIQAALTAARELAGPIIAMSIVLIAVYVPIGFQGGLTGALFVEFAFTLVGTVVISTIIALTLSPMMASRLLHARHEHDTGIQARFERFVDRRFDGLRGWYSRRLHNSLDYLAATLLFAFLVLGSIYFMAGSSKSELAPQEDQGFMITSATAAPNATLAQRQLYSNQLYDIFKSIPETDHAFQFDVPGQSFSGLVLKPWGPGRRSADVIQNQVLTPQVHGVAGANVFVFQPPSLPGAFGAPIQFVIGTTEPFDRLNDVTQQFLRTAQQSGEFIFLDTDLKIDSPQALLVIDRDKAAQLGVQMSDIGAALGWALGGGYVNFFALDGRPYKVIPQVQQGSRLNPDQLLNYYIHTPSGAVIPLSTIAHIENKTVPESLNHFQQLNAATFQGAPTPGVTTGEALAYLQDLAKRTLPQGYTVDYGGQSRQFVQESSGFVVTLTLAVIIIFLALSALFESFRDPIIILVSVPMSIAGALFFITLGVASLNIYTDVGLVTLMGLISKHGILMVEFANSLQEQGKSKREAIETAASIRLRPILMTTAAMVLGVIPLLTASGAGAISRFDMGLVIASGISIGTLFTLFVLPAVYMLLSADRSKKKATEEARGVPV